jgi:hypothetical protein
MEGRWSNQAAQLLADEVRIHCEVGEDEMLMIDANSSKQEIEGGIRGRIIVLQGEHCDDRTPITRALQTMVDLKLKEGLPIALI